MRASPTNVPRVPCGLMVNPTSTTAEQFARSVTHGLRPMSGRDPHDEHRPATPLELLFDLTFVIALGVAGSELAHLLAEGHYRAGLISFAVAMFAVIWAWIEYTWFASAYDTDDWVYRLLTMVQMMGVIILALGIPDVFRSIDHGEVIDNRVMVLGYVVMRVPMVAQWLRAARQDPARRVNCVKHAVAIAFPQIIWIALAVAEVTVSTAMWWLLPVILLEIGGPFIAERRGEGTPWHALHIAERYGLLAIIALGEVLIGTVAAVGAVIDVQGWTFDVALFVISGVVLTFGLWWTYFLLPPG